MASIYADNCQLATVQAAISGANSGDVVYVPAGSASWSEQLTGKDGVSLEGAGIGSTNITISHGGYGIYHSGTAGNTFGYGGMSFTRTNGIIFYVRGGVKGFRIHHCSMVHSSPSVGGEAMYFGNPDDTDYQYGVVDNCTFTDCRPVVFDYGGGHNSWKRALDLGGPDAIYFEDCTFTYNTVHTTIIDSNYGGRYVIRYCDINNSGALAHSLQIASPYFTGGFGRGTRKVEFYENAIRSVATGYANWQGIHIRAGTGVAYNNAITNTPGADDYLFVVGIDNDRSFWSLPTPLLQADGSNYIDGNTTVANGSGTHTGANGASGLTDSTKSWTADQFVQIPVTDGQVNLHTIYNITDGSHGFVTDNGTNTVTATLSGGTRNNWNNGDSYRITDGWPALDQIGRSTDHGTGTDFSPQESDPFYAWGNTIGGVSQDVYVLNNCSRHIQENRDYYNSERPGYVPYTYPHPLRTEEYSADTFGPYYLTVDDTDDQAYLYAEHPKARVVAGGNVTYVVHAKAWGSFSGDITLDMTGLPTNATDSYGTNPISETGSCVVTVATTGVAAGTYSMYITGTSDGGDVASIRVVLEVVEAADFDLKIDKRYVRAKQGDNAVFTIRADSLSGFASDINLDTQGMPEGADATFGDSSLAYNGSTTLTIDTTNIEAGTHEFYITGT